MPNDNQRVLPALDALRENHLPEDLQFLRGRKIGLLTNHTGTTQDGASTLSVLRELDLNVAALFSPEHGFSGTREGNVESGSFETLSIHSLYGETRRPTRAMLAGIEVLVCDLQDVGARFYTYASTLAICLEECAKFGVAVLVLDRPNPIGGETIEGPNCDAANKSFIGYLDVPIRHAMTIGELALLHRSDKSLDVELRVARVLGWHREMLWRETKLSWPVPSPNLPDWESALWYPGICLLEFSGVSVGRGTDAPFQIVGAPWLDSARVLDAMRNWPDEVRANFSAEAIEFIPTRGEYSGELCRGIRFEVRGSRFEKIVPLGLYLLSTLHATHEEFDLGKSLLLLGSSKVLECLRVNDLESAMEICARDGGKFRARREEFLIYE